MVATAQLPLVVAEPVITVTSEALQAAARHWAEQHCFQFSAWLTELSDAAKLDQVPIRMTLQLAKEIGLACTKS